MSGQALQAELTSLAQEAKRKNPEIRTVCYFWMGITRQLVLMWNRLQRNHYRISNPYLQHQNNNWPLVSCTCLVLMTPTNEQEI